MIYLCIALTVSVLANTVLIVLYLKPQKKPKKDLTKDARELLQDLMTGPALLKVEYVDREDIFLRSPRDH